MKRIVINADDFGLCDSINHGIIYCMEKGIVSDLSFIINKPFLYESIELLIRKGILNIGVHFNFTMGKPILSNNSNLTGSDGLFNNTLNHFGNYLKGKLNADVIYKEGKAQLDILISNGFNITHFDTHHNVHILPPFFEAINKLRQEINPGAFIRIPYEYIKSPLNNNLSNLKRILILNFFSQSINKRNGNNNSVETIGGNFYNNKNPHKIMKKIFENISKSKSEEFEIAVHPGFYSKEIIKYDTYVKGRETELNYLSGTNQSLVTQRIKIVNFADLISDRISINNPC